jgi:hypothetical protein
MVSHGLRERAHVEDAFCRQRLDLGLPHRPAVNCHRAILSGLRLLNAVMVLRLHPLDEMKTQLPSLNSAADAFDYAGQMTQFRATAENEKALLLAGWLLDQSHISTDEFSAAIDALFWATEEQRPWAPKVERAYHRFSPRQKKAIRSLMLCFYGHAGLHERTISQSRGSGICHARKRPTR